MTHTPSLRQVQHWLLEAITAPSHDLADAANYIRAEARLSPAEQTSIYREGYRARLIECLSDDYPVFKRTVGQDAFTTFAHGYINAHPSHSPNLNVYSCHLADFLLQESLGQWAPHRAFLSDLCRLEWAIVQALHAPIFDALPAASLSELPVAAWAHARFVPAPSLVVLRSDYPVNAYFQGAMDDDVSALSVPVLGPSAVAIYRNAQALWRRALTPAMCAMLIPLLEGKTLGQAIASIEQSVTDSQTLEELSTHLSAWFAEWCAEGFFERVDVEQT